VKPVRLNVLAKAEMLAAAAWYRDASPSAAERFLARARRTMELIEHFPQAGSPVRPFKKGTRRMWVRGYPYQLVYVDVGDHIEIIAVAHDSRRPGYWRKRIQ